MRFAHLAVICRAIWDFRMDVMRFAHLAVRDRTTWAKRMHPHRGQTVTHFPTQRG